MKVKIERVYRGVANGDMRRFKSRIGEWGPTFPVKEKRIVVSEAAGTVSWSPAIEQAGKIFIDPRRMQTIGGVPTPASDSSALAALDDLLERVPTAHGH